MYACMCENRWILSISTFRNATIFGTIFRGEMKRKQDMNLGKFYFSSGYIFQQNNMRIYKKNRSSASFIRPQKLPCRVFPEIFN